ncbi:MAG: hypothetical protein ACPHWV_02035 [Candidatus Puniceispirillum sp.]
MKIILSLQMRATIWIISAGLAGILSSWLWMYSEAQWKQHLHKSYMSGLSLFETVRDGTPPIDGLQLAELPLPSTSGRSGALFAITRSGTRRSHHAYVIWCHIIDQQHRQAHGTRGNIAGSEISCCRA